VKIVVIGGGAAGTLFVANWLKQASPTDKLIWIEQSGHFGAGLAYSEANQDYHILNVRAGQMHAYTDDPNHFLRWMSGNGFPCNPEDFVARKLYGRYLKSIADKCLTDLRIQPFTQEVISFSEKKQGWEIKLVDTTTISCDSIILATGNLLPARPTALPSTLNSHPAYQRNPWHYNTPTNPDATILLLGAGLTMIDQLLHLQAIHHRGKIISLSPHGFLPLAHPAFPQKWPLDESVMLVHRSPLEWLRFFRAEIQKAQAEKYDAFAVADAFRPYVQTIWQRWNKTEHESFRQHLRHRWAQLRHRLPLKVAKKIDVLKNSGQVEIHAGRLLDVAQAGELLRVRWHTRGTGEIKNLDVDLFVNCTGPSSRFESDGSLLLKNLLAENILVQDVEQLGFAALPSGALKKPDGNPYTNAFALGSLLRGTLWEITAVPDIRNHIRQVLDLLLAK
jgi:uncharacterized NAD(P)/FAD-binding protein YdhS